MKNLALTFTLLLSTIFSFAQDNTQEKEEKGQTITVTINNIKNNKGQVMIALHTADTFMKGQGVKNQSVNIENGKVKVTFTNVAPGNYAIMTLHDENKNNRMDFENGMPKENYGMSNNPMSYGPPQYSEAKFDVSNEDLEFNIRF